MVWIAKLLAITSEANIFTRLWWHKESFLQWWLRNSEYFGHHVYFSSNNRHGTLKTQNSGDKFRKEKRREVKIYETWHNLLKTTNRSRWNAAISLVWSSYCSKNTWFGNASWLRGTLIGLKSATIPLSKVTFNLNCVPFSISSKSEMR